MKSAQLLRGHQLKLPEGELVANNPLGIPPHETQLALQQDVCKELANKIAWTLGSVYRRSYANMRTPARAYAWELVKQILRDHGYPDKIGK